MSSHITADNMLLPFMLSFSEKSVGSDKFKFSCLSLPLSFKGQLLVGNLPKMLETALLAHSLNDGNQSFMCIPGH